MRIFVASDDPGISHQLRKQLLGLGQDCPASQVVSLDHAVPLLSSLADAAPATTPTGGEAPRGRTSAESDLVFVVLPPAVDRSLDVVRDIRRQVQPLHLFVVGPTTDSKFVLRAMREGAHEYLDQADLAQELVAAIDRLKVKDSGRLRARTIALLSPSDLAPYVVADLSHSFLETMAPVLTHADQILLVLRLGFTSLRNTRRVLDHLEQDGIPRDRIRVVANRYGRPGELTVSEAQTALGLQISHFVLDDPKNVNRANNQGMPVVQYAPSAKVFRQLTELALSLVVSEKHPLS